MMWLCSEQAGLNTSLPRSPAARITPCFYNLLFRMSWWDGLTAAPFVRYWKSQTVLQNYSVRDTESGGAILLFSRVLFNRGAFHSWRIIFLYLEKSIYARDESIISQTSQESSSFSVEKSGYDFQLPWLASKIDTVTRIELKKPQYVGEAKHFSDSMPGQVADDTEEECSFNEWTWAHTIQGHPMLAMYYTNVNTTLSLKRHSQWLEIPGV